MIVKDILVVTPTLGNRDTINDTIASVRKIGGERVDHMIVCPADRMDGMRERFPHCIIADEGDGSGIYSALNGAILPHLDKYQYLTYINDDDFWLPGFSELIQLISREAVDFDIVYGKVDFVKIDGSHLREVAFGSRPKALPFLLPHSIIPFTQQGFLMKSEVFLRLNGFNTSFRLIADTEFWLRALLNNFQFKAVKIIVAGYRIHEGQLSNASELQRIEHLRLEQAYGLKRSLRSYLEYFIFRIKNIDLYLKRYI